MEAEGVLEVHEHAGENDQITLDGDRGDGPVVESGNLQECRETLVQTAEG